MSSFVIDLTQLSQGSSRVRLEADAPDIDLPAEGWPGRVTGEIQFERSGEKLTIRGQVRSSAWLECVRCLKSFELPMDVPLELYVDRSGTGNRRDELELERDDYMLFHDGRKLDLGAPAREALLLELPMAPHCRDDCKGLCPRCGADLNDGPCACGEPAEIRTA